MAKRVGLVGLTLLLLAIHACSNKPPVSDPAAIATSVSSAPADKAPAAPTAAEVRALLNAGDFAQLDLRFSAVQAAYRNRAISDEGLYQAFLAFYESDPTLKAGYDGWVQKYPKSYVAHLARGIYYRKVGQAARGGEYIDKTSDSQLAGMDAAYEIAARELDTSMQLDARPLLSLSNKLDIAGYDGDRVLLNQLVEKSVQLDPQNSVVRRLYMGFLEPRWGGSTEAMSAFLEVSVKTGLAKAKLPLLEAVIVADQGDGYRHAGNYPAAEAAYRKAIALGGDECLACLSEVLVKEKKYDEAIVYLTKLIAAKPSDTDAIAQRAWLYIQTGRQGEAVADLKAGAALNNTYSLNQLGIFYMEGVAGLPRDPVTGLATFKKCAALGSADCERNAKLAQIGP
jgi:tetratricopeptide (TPR) repeat protein